MFISAAVNSDPFDLQANPDPNQCLGVFGLSLYPTEKALREGFGRYGPLAGVNVVYDQRTGRSRGFAFVYFERIADSKEVWDKQSSLGIFLKGPSPQNLSNGFWEGENARNQENINWERAMD